MTKKELVSELKGIIDSPELLEVGRKAIEDELVEWRDSGMFTLRNNGLVIKYRDGSESSPCDANKFVSKL